MDFDFTDEQLALRDLVARWVDKGFGFERRHAAARSGGMSRDVWRELAALGLSGLAVADDHGGLGLGAVEAMVVMEELGRGLVHAPYAAAGLMAPVLLRAAEAPAAPIADGWLARIASGEAMVVPALHEREARHRWWQVRAQAHRDADGAWRLTGHKGMVPAADEADAFLVPARVADMPQVPPAEVDDVEAHLPGMALFLIEAGAPGLTRHAYPTQDGGRAGELVLAGAPAQLLASEAGAALAEAVDVGIAAACAEGVGLMERMLALTTEYMNTRRQFGVPIASFQALRHRVADLKMALELARAMSYYATLKLGEPPAERARALAQAKLQLGLSSRFVGQQGVQLHGGIGVTDEYVGSHVFKRLTALELTLGDSLHHLAQVSRRMGDTAGVFV